MRSGTNRNWFIGSGVETMKGTQCERVLRYITDFGSITPLQAMADLGCMRLASRISDLKQMGYPIRKRMVAGKNRYRETTHYAEYYLEEN